MSGHTHLTTLLPEASVAYAFSNMAEPLTKSHLNERADLSPCLLQQNLVY